MKALIMAAGYATRLYPLTKDRAKPLLSIAGRPIIDYIIDSLNAVQDIDRIYVVTNSRFAASFEEWAGTWQGATRAPISIIDDGTVSDDDKLGAIGDIKFVLDRECFDDDLLVVLGDNLFDLDVENLVAFFKEKGTTIGAYDVRDKEAAKLYGILAVDENSRVVDFLEKPSNPPSTLAAMGMYLYPKEKLGLFQVYAEEGNKMDAPGYFVKWLYNREPVYAYAFNGVWYDIGDLEMYKKADAIYAAKYGETISPE